jgi:DNA polymerase III sliding clamp (beta) subunit (PCNA family)
MKTLQGINVKKAIELAKPFVGNLNKKNFGRLILKNALVTEKYVIATDSHRLIRISHNNRIEKPYIHEYKNFNVDFEPVNYPDTSRLMPDPYNAQKEILISVNDWIEAHSLALIAAKEHQNKVIHLSENVFSVNAMKTFINKKGKEEKQPDFEQISYKYTLPFSTAIEKVSYNCEYMLQALKVFKKMKVEQVKLYFYGPLRPFLLKSEDIEIIILPVRSN